VAAEWGTPGQMRVLLERGADVTLQTSGNGYDPAGMTALHEFADTTSLNERNNIAKAELLMAAGADVNARDASGRTPSRVAREHRNQALARMLEQRGGRAE
jgi:ankyrin repeat protein